MHRILLLLLAGALGALSAACTPTRPAQPIDRQALVGRNCPHIASLDTLSSLTVGNGGFAFTVDATGLQTFPERYRLGVPLGTQSQWGWHSFPNTEGFTPEETLAEYDFGRGRKEPYAVQFKEPGRQHEAAEWFRVNPHRLHLGTVGFFGLKPEELADIDQTLDLWRGAVHSRFTARGGQTEVTTACSPAEDVVAATVRSAARLPVVVRFAYPTGAHSDDGCDWMKEERHLTEIVGSGEGWALLRRTIDSTVYYVRIGWTNASAPEREGLHAFVLRPSADEWSFTVRFSAEPPKDGRADASEILCDAARHWEAFWQEGAAVDFSRCTDVRARELERRVVLSQYLLAVQCAGAEPPQETGLTYNSWFGKFHLEMLWWHQAHFILWGHEELAARTLKWYKTVLPQAREIARRQGFEGVRWMKMTDPSGTEAPSGVGSFLVWQQPHPIYLAELLYRARPERETLDEWYDIVQESARFMASFADYDAANDRYVLRGLIPAQETLRAAETVNPPFELAYWHFALSTAQRWRERRGEERIAEWDAILGKLSRPAAREGLYLAAESAPETYEDRRFTSDHMAVLAAEGMVPHTPLIDPGTLRATLGWVMKNWNWERTWGWDHPLTALCAARMGEPQRAVEALLAGHRTNTYLPNGHNFQDGRLRCYLPGNGALLTAVALMCAGWDGCEEPNPGFPKDGSWEVRWEGLHPMP